MKIAVLLTSLVPLSFLMGATEDWIIDAPGGDWGVAANWNPAVVPNAVDEEAAIGTPILSGPCTISLTTVSPKVGYILFISQNSNGYTISSPSTNSLTFQVSANSATIDVADSSNNNASHTISAPIILSSNLIVSQRDTSNTLTLSGIISGAGSLTTDESGDVHLGGVNNFSGGLFINGGAVFLDTPNALLATGPVTIGAGRLHLNNGGLVIGALSGATGSNGINLLGNTLTVNTTGSNSYSGNLVGTPGALTVGGSGTLTLGAPSSPNVYGLTTITGGTLRLGASNVLPTAADLTLTGGVFDLNNFNQTVTNLSATGGSITLGVGHLTIQPTANEIFSAVISGVGSVIYDGNTSTWSLDAAQTYTGGTTINSGGIKLGIDNGLPIGRPVTLAGSGFIDLSNFSQTVGTLTAIANTQLIHLGSGQLTVAPTASANFAGVIDGTGSLVFQGPFAWTIQTSQTYTGGTTISGGTLQMGVANGIVGPVTINNPGILALNSFPLTIASLSGNGDVDVTGNTLTLSTTTTTTFAGAIVGAGHLTVSGTGTQILTGSNFYSAGTDITASAMLEGTTTSLQGIIANGGTLFFNQGFNGTFSGTLLGGGLLQVGGGGIVTLIGNPIQGNVSVLSGDLSIGPGAFLTATTAVMVGSGGTLGGTGTIITPNIFVSGTINPGDVTPDGTLEVIGNVAFQSGSTFEADLTSATSDRLNVVGQVSIDPNAQIIIHAARGDYQEETVYSIITSTVPVVGQFQSFRLTNPFLEADIFYNRLLGGSVEIDLKIRNLSDVIQGGNAGAIAKCITETNMKNDHDLESLIAEIIFLSVHDATEIVEQMQPSQLRALTVAEQTNALFAQQILSWRMAQFDNSLCQREVAQRFPWNFWLSLAGNWTDQRHDKHNLGYSAPAAGFSIGFDGRISDNLYLGLAAEYGHVSLQWEENGGSSTINHMSAGPYLSFVGRRGYINTSILASWAHFDATRSIPSFNRSASSTHNGETLTPHLDVGLVFHPALNVLLTPFAMLDFVYGWEGSYQESGAESLNFSIASTTSSLLRSEIGLKISKCAVRSHTKWVHDMKASWVREERLHGKDLTATFRQFPCTFTVEGLYPSRNFLDVGMGLTFLFKQDRFAASLRYEGQFGEGVNIQSGIAQLLTCF
jgi:autotransporter-associated beta strand protein